jgi:hypothetical protein
LNLDLLTPKKRENNQFETQLLNLMKHKQSPKSNFLYKQVVNQYPNINLQKQKKPLVALKRQQEGPTTIMINKDSENLKIAKDDSRLEGLKLDLNMTSYLNELGESSLSK